MNLYENYVNESVKYFKYRAQDPEEGIQVCRTLQEHRDYGCEETVQLVRSVTGSDLITGRDDRLLQTIQHTVLILNGQQFLTLIPVHVEVCL